MTCSACAPSNSARQHTSPFPSDGERPRVAVPYTTPPFRARTAGVSIRDLPAARPSQAVRARTYPSA
jgi:hypothetical protein